MSEDCIAPTQSDTILSNIFNYLIGLSKATVQKPTEKSADLYLLYITSHGEIIVTQENKLDLINVPDEIDLTYIPIAKFGHSVELKTTCVNNLCSNLQTQISCDDKCSIIRNIKTKIEDVLDKNVDIYDAKKIINKRYTQKMSDLRNTTEIHNEYSIQKEKNVDMNMLLYKYNIRNRTFEPIQDNLFEFFINNKDTYKESNHTYKKRNIDGYPINVKNNVTFYDILKYFKEKNIHNVVVIDLGCNTIEGNNAGKAELIQTHYQQYNSDPNTNNKRSRIGGYKKYTKRLRNKKRKTKRKK